MITNFKKFLTVKMAVLLGSSMVLALYIFRTAWLSDDAMITLRSVIMLFNGHGPVIEQGVRVQGFTHPLWYWTLALTSFMTREFIYTSIFLGLFFTVAAFFLASKTFMKAHSIVIFLVLILTSRSVIDYSTSGLENSLTYFLVILLLATFFDKIKVTKNKELIITLISCLMVLNRFDYIFLTLPILIATYFTHIKDKNIKFILKTGILGFLPAILWHSFSIIYYGSVFPNTANAKLNVNISTIAKVKQGVHYFVNTMKYDLGGYIVILLGGCLVVYLLWKNRSPKMLAVTASLFIYQLYILYIGGDFMAGRFYAVIIVMFAWLITTHIDQIESFEFSSLLIAMSCLVILATSISTSWVNIVRNDSGILHISDSNGVADERGFYAHFGQSLFNREQVVDKLLQERFLNLQRDFKFKLKAKKPSDGYILKYLSKSTKHIDQNHNDRVIACGGLGLVLLFSNDKATVSDPCGLVDPFFARLPYEIPEDGVWRTGHYNRPVPKGYPKTTKNLTKHQKKILHEAEVITTGKLFTSERVKLVLKGLL
jgi:arabinofuranosyltransferase